MAKREPLRPLHIPVPFDEAVKAMLGTPPPPKDTPGKRTGAAKAKKRKAKRR